MNFFKFPLEIRLKIYSEIFVYSEPIDLTVDYGSSSPPLFEIQKHQIYPAVLRVSRMMHHEAVPLLYFGNCFRFPADFIPSEPTSFNHIRLFLDQIGSHASLIRHIGIPIPHPEFDYPEAVRPMLREAHKENLELIRDNCTGTQTLELAVPPQHYNDLPSDTVIPAETLKSLDESLKSIPSLKKIIINFALYAQHYPSDTLTRKMHDYGWTITFIWISDDDQEKFENEEDCDTYNDENSQLEEQENEVWGDGRNWWW